MSVVPDPGTPCNLPWVWTRPMVGAEWGLVTHVGAMSSHTTLKTLIGAWCPVGYKRMVAPWWVVFVSIFVLLWPRIAVIPRIALPERCDVVSPDWGGVFLFCCLGLVEVVLFCVFVDVLALCTFAATTALGASSRTDMANLPGKWVIETSSHGRQTFSCTGGGREATRMVFTKYVIAGIWSWRWIWKGSYT